MITDDLKNKLDKEPEHQSMIKEKERKLKELELMCAEDEKDMLKELKSEGYKVSSVWDFVNNNVRYSFLRKFTGTYERAYPILVKHLRIEHHPRVREGIIRALTEKDANSTASEALLNVFYEEKDPYTKWVLSNALRTVLSPSQKRKHPEYKDIYNAKGQP